MKRLRNRIRRDERGASLILAIAFMLVAGAIGAGVTTSVTSGINDSSVLALARNRDYAAEGALNYAIVQMRTTAPASSIGLTACAAPFYTTTLPVRGSQNIDIRVDCFPAPEVTPALSARNNVIFLACVETGQLCSDATAIIRTQINFQVSATSGTVTKTFVQTWSVKG